jgi:Recombination endonuclease VII
MPRRRWYAPGLADPWEVDVPDPKPCARCKTAQRRTSRSTYCAACSATTKREFDDRRRLPVDAPCARCKVNPRVTGHSYCAECKRRALRESRARHPDRAQEICSRCRRPRTGRHPSYCTECFAAWKAERAKFCTRCKIERKVGDGSQWGYCSRCQRDVWMRRNYRISIDDYEAMLATQGHRCALCESPDNGRQWHVDHDHDTGAVRGILCDNCNRGLGHFRDDPTVLRRAAQYLERIQV